MLKDDNVFRTADDADPRTALLFGFSLETEWETPTQFNFNICCSRNTQTFEFHFTNDNNNNNDVVFAFWVYVTISTTNNITNKTKYIGSMFTIVTHVYIYAIAWILDANDCFCFTKLIFQLQLRSPMFHQLNSGNH